jgi:hypothetical protein
MWFAQVCYADLLASTINIQKRQKTKLKTTFLILKNMLLIIIIVFK